jgi:phosphoglycerate dehydrogenase-like enzyme
MLPVWIHIMDDHPGYRLADEVAALHANRPQWRITVGLQPPAAAAYQVLVAGVPSRELLAASPALHTVHLPFAGVPRQTREILAEFPHLNLRSLHHNAGPTAELALALTMAAARGVVAADAGMRRHDWTTRFVAPQPCLLLDGHPATVVGYGHIGRRVARGLAAVGMTVRATTASATRIHRDECTTVHPASQLTQLLSDSRVTVLCLPSTADTVGLMGAAKIALLPDPSVLINVSRADIVDEAALYRRLRSGTLAAGIDVWPDEASEPAQAQGFRASKYPFHQLPNVVLSPHRGGGFSLPESRALRVRHLERSLAELARDEERN